MAITKHSIKIKRLKNILKNFESNSKAQTARKTINKDGTYNTENYLLPRTWVNIIPANRIQQEYDLYRRTRVPKKNQSIRKSQQCEATTKKSKFQVQCRKRTAHTPKCWIHLAHQDNLRVKPSNIENAGKGLFVWKKPFPANKKISNYTGRKMTQGQVDAKYGLGLAEYAMCDQGKCVDANFTTDAASRFVNDSRGSRYPNNSEFCGRNYKYYLKSIKRIKPGQEIFTSYGPMYWRHKK